MRRKGWWHVPALLLLAAALFVALLFVEADDRKDKQKRNQIEESAAALEKQRDELIAQRDQLLRSYQERTTVPGTEQLLFLELDERLYTEVYPLMRQRGFSGVLGLSRDSFPGDPGMISRVEFDELLQNGWTVCLVCEDGSRFAEWDEEIGARLDGEQIPKPETVYFPDNQFRASLQEEILRCGYSVAVHHGEERLPMTAEEAGDGLWLVGAHPWNYVGVKAQIDEIARRQDEHCFTLRFSPGREEYTEISFVNMMEFLEQLCSGDSLRVTGFSDARRLHDPSLNGVREARETWERQDAELVEQIRVVEEQIHTVYDAWNKD